MWAIRTTGMREMRVITYFALFSAKLCHQREAFGCLEVEIHHLKKAQQLKFENIKVIASGLVLAVVVTEVKYGKSTIKVTMGTSLPGEVLVTRVLSTDPILQIPLDAVDGLPRCHLSV